MADAALDNDVILKCAAYGVLDDLLAALPEGPHAHGVLGAARFMLPKRLRRKRINRMDDALRELATALGNFEVLEPDHVEQHLAAQLEFNAQQRSEPLDVGEAQLVTMVISRGLRHLLTGDKRAIAALAATPFPDALDRSVLNQRLICLEQAIWALIEGTDAAAIRQKVCAEPEVDTQLRICFSCSSPTVEETSWREGLRSAIEALRASSPDLLSPI